MADPDLPMARPGDAVSIARTLKGLGEKTGKCAERG